MSDRNENSNIGLGTAFCIGAATPFVNLFYLAARLKSKSPYFHRDFMQSAEPGKYGIYVVGNAAGVGLCFMIALNAANFGFEKFLLDKTQLERKAPPAERKQKQPKDTSTASIQTASVYLTKKEL